MCARGCALPLIFAENSTAPFCKTLLHWIQIIEMQRKKKLESDQSIQSNDSSTVCVRTAQVCNDWPARQWETACCKIIIFCALYLAIQAYVLCTDTEKNTCMSRNELQVCILQADYYSVILTAVFKQARFQYKWAQLEGLQNTVLQCILKQ